MVSPFLLELDTVDAVELQNNIASTNTAMANAQDDVERSLAAKELAWMTVLSDLVS